MKKHDGPHVSAMRQSVKKIPIGNTRPKLVSSPAGALRRRPTLRGHVTGAATSAAYRNLDKSSINWPCRDVCVFWKMTSAASSRFPPQCRAGPPRLSRSRRASAAGRMRFRQVSDPLGPSTLTDRGCPQSARVRSQGPALVDEAGGDTMCWTALQSPEAQS